MKKDTRPCPFCKKPAAWDNNKWRPFCSKRCKMIDLGFWAMGEYRIAAEDVPNENAADGGEDEKDKE